MQPASTGSATTTHIEKIFPFSIDTSDKEYAVSIHIEDVTVSSKYGSLFKKYKLNYDIETWQEVMTQMIRKWLPYMESTVSFFDDNKILYIQPGNKIYEGSMTETLHPIFYDMATLDEFFKNLDRTNLDTP
ncbi:hypothetical protein DN068_18985 [Taibaiella soli]|uniref:Uncharacterized protein n=1 Tax=Taibaiella soli TaxID=1649169 RepID=A0A2W2B5X2_9BACT|nr:hypothetical protein DN068_18985 [Taibaiella soli]